MAIVPLITLETARLHARYPETLPDDTEDDMVLKIAEATSIIVVYLKGQADPTWTAETVPEDVRAAICRQFMHLWQARGDQDVSNIRRITDLDDDGLAPGVKGPMTRRRDPALA